jgi:hypothetical protein
MMPPTTAAFSKILYILVAQQTTQLEIERQYSAVKSDIIFSLPTNILFVLKAENTIWK